MGTEARLSHGLAIEPGVRLRMPGFMFNRWLMALERFGLVVRGVLYALVGVFAITAMLGMSQSVDLQGSVTLVLANPLKVPVGLVAAAGLFGYALWGVVRALADLLERGGALHGIVSREIEPETLVECLPLISGTLDPPDPRYVTDYGHTESEIVQFAVDSLNKRLRAIGINLAA